MVKFSVRHPVIVTVLMVLLAAVLGTSAAIRGVKIDTDPENMLSADDPARVFHDQMKEKFSVHDMIVVGVVNEEDPDGVFNPESLRRIYALTNYARQLRGDGLKPGRIEMDRILADAGLIEAPAESGPQKTGEAEEQPPPPPPPAGGEASDEGPPPLPGGDTGEEAPPPLPGGGEEDLPPLPGTGEETPGEPTEAAERAEAQQKGVVVIDLLAPSMVDRIEHKGGSVHFSYLLQKPLPETREEAAAVREGALDNPLLNGTVVSSDGQSVRIYLPITQKDISYQISRRLEEFIARLEGPEEYHITGLPVAEDTFGHEMFVQMGISAPLAMLVIFILMFIFFRKLVLIISPMILAMVSVICTMGLLIGLGYTVHIMSSMIPIFIMPIAVLDAVHLLSEFFDRYQETRDRRATILTAMDDLFVPMLYTSLTSAAGFASLALTPIPPVQVFGVFVAFGIMVAWVLTVTFIPAFVMFIPESRLEGFGVSQAEEVPDTLLTRILRWAGGFTYRRTKWILTGALIVLAIAAYGITLIDINDNPTKWFVSDHPIRVADRVLNRHFAGTYQAYLRLKPQQEEMSAADAAEEVRRSLRHSAEDFKEEFPEQPQTAVFERAQEMVTDTGSGQVAGAYLQSLLEKLQAEREGTEGPTSYAWDEVIAAVERRQLALEQPFKDPELLRYIGELQEALVAEGADGRSPVGKSNSVVDIVKKVYKELSGDPENYRVPDTRRGVAQALFEFGGSHTPDDLWHFVTPDYKQGNLWLQLKSGDNNDMERLIRRVKAHFQENPPPMPLDHRWFGLTYINVEWQDQMVSGMLMAFLGSFLVVFVLMTALFRSPLWGLLSMVPLTVTIAFIYGVIGLVGKDYDMPVAVLSSLTLGLAVDFAIHFLARSRAIMGQAADWREGVREVFGEPARAISRNAIVVAVGFLPLLAAPLIPYKTVGFLMATILAVAAMATLFLLPALIKPLRRWLFAEEKEVGVTCNCIACIVLSIAAVLAIALSAAQYFHVGWNWLTWAGLALIPVLVVLCGLLSRRRACERLEQQEHQDAKGENPDETT